MSKKNYRQSFGCCANIPEALLHSGDSWDYPKWYIKYILGEGERKLPKMVRKLLEYLDDGSWKVNVGVTGVGLGTIEAMIELELICMSSVARPFKIFVAESDYGSITDIDDPKEFAEDFKNIGNGFIGAYRITNRGREAVLQNSLP